MTTAVFMYSDDAVLPCLSLLQSLSNVKAIAVSTNHPDITNQSGKVTLESICKDYDIGFSVFNKRILDPREIEIPKLGWVNIHPAPLPRIGGRNVFYHGIILAYEEDDWRFGVTAHYMIDAVDQGPIIDLIDVPISRQDTAGSLHDRAVSLILPMFERNLTKLLEGHVETIEGQRGMSNKMYHSADIDFRIDLTWPEDKISAYVRALSQPGKRKPYAVIDGTRVTLDVSHGEND